MNLKYIAIVLLLLLIVLAEAQRGGGSRSGSAGGFRRGGTKKSKQEQLKSSQRTATFFQYVTAFVLSKEMSKYLYDKALENAWIFNAFFAFSIILHLLMLKAVWNFFTKRNIMKKYQKSKELQPCLISSKQCQDKANLFKSKKWLMVFENNDGSIKKSECSIKNIQLTKSSEFKFDVTMEGDDFMGGSKFKGILLFYGSIMGLFLFKHYDDKTKAHQKGSYSELTYEGQFYEDSHWRGIWQFQSHKNDPQFRGTWKMSEVKQQ